MRLFYGLPFSQLGSNNLQRFPFSELLLRRTFLQLFRWRPFFAGYKTFDTVSELRCVIRRIFVHGIPSLCMLFTNRFFDAADMFVPFDHPVRWKGLGCERQTLHVKNGFEPERVFVMTMAASREWDV